MRRVLWILVLTSIAAPGVRAGDEAVDRFYVRFERAKLRVTSDLEVSLVGFVVPGAGEDGKVFEAHLVDPKRFEARRIQPHLFQVRLDGNDRTFWRLDTHAGRAWLVTDGLFGLVGGSAKHQPWVRVQSGPNGRAATADLRDLELSYGTKKKAVSLKGAGLTLAGANHLKVEVLTAWSFHVTPSFGWDGSRLEVDVGAREVRFGRGSVSQTGVGETAVRLDLPLSFWLRGGRYGAKDANVPRLLEPEAGASLDNGRYDTFDLMIREYRWTEVPGADKYQIYVKSRTAANPAVDEDVSRPYYREESRAHVIKRNLKGWEWKVRAFRGRKALPWSEVRPFGIEPADTDPPDDSVPHLAPGPVNPGSAPKLIDPKPGATMDNGRADGSDPTEWKFRWARVGKATEYEIAVLHDTAYPVVRARVKGTQYQFESSTLRTFGFARTQWHWRVRGIRRGEAMPWSAPSPFVVEALDSDPPENAEPPSATERKLIPKLLSPKPGALLKNKRKDQKRKVTWEFRWTAVSGAEGYEVRFQRRGSGSGPTTLRTDKPSLERERKSRVKKLYCYGYTWRVRAVIDGKPQPWSETRNFDIQPPI